MSDKEKVLLIEAHSDDSAISTAGFLEKFREKYDYHFVLSACSDIDLHHKGLITRDERLKEYEAYVKHFDGIRVVNSFEKKELIKTGVKEKKVSIIPIAIDKDLFSVPIKEVVTQYQDYVEVASDGPELVTAVTSALTKDVREKHRSYAQKYSWKAVVEEMITECKLS